MNLFIGLLGIIIVVIAMGNSVTKFTRNNKLDENLKNGLIKQEEYKKKYRNHTTNICVAVLGIFLFVFSFSFVIIPTGYSGVKTTFGQVSQKTMPNGFNFKLPFIQKVEKVNNKQQDIVFDENKISSETSERNAVIFKGITVTY